LFLFGRLSGISASSGAISDFTPFTRPLSDLFKALSAFDRFFSSIGQDLRRQFAYCGCRHVPNAIVGTMVGGKHHDIKSLGHLVHDAGFIGGCMREG